MCGDSQLVSQPLFVLEDNFMCMSLCTVLFLESRSLGLERKTGGRFHLQLNMCVRPIANKYHEGKMKRTLERELKVIELAEWEADGSSEAEQFFHILHIAGQLPCTWNQICAWCFLWCLLLCLS